MTENKIKVTFKSASLTIVMYYSCLACRRCSQKQKPQQGCTTKDSRFRCATFLWGHFRQARSFYLATITSFGIKDFIRAFSVFSEVESNSCKYIGETCRLTVSSKGGTKPWSSCRRKGLRLCRLDSPQRLLTVLMVSQCQKSTCRWTFWWNKLNWTWRI